MFHSISCICDFFGQFCLIFDQLCVSPESVSYTCDFFDKLCLIFDQLCVSFSQLYMCLFRSVVFDIRSVVCFIQSVIHVTFSISCV